MCVMFMMGAEMEARQNLGENYRENDLFFCDLCHTFRYGDNYAFKHLWKMKKERRHHTCRHFSNAGVQEVQ